MWNVLFYTFHIDIFNIQEIELMNRNGFIRVAAAVPRVEVADCHANADHIIDLARKMAADGVRLAVFPELSVTAYTCGDLFLQPTLIDSAFEELHRIARETAELPMVLVVGVPLMFAGALRNCGAVISSGEVKGVQTKEYLPNYGEFYEKRWFRHDARAQHTLFVLDGVRFGVEICEDLWAPIPVSTHQALAGAEIIVNLSASNDLVGKRAKVLELVTHQSTALRCAYVYSASGYGESTTDLVFDGKAIIAELGQTLADSPRWQRDAYYESADLDVQLIRSERVVNSSFTDCRVREDGPEAWKYIDVTPTAPAKTGNELRRPIDPMPFVPADPAKLELQCVETSNIQSLGLAKRMQITRSENVVIGISGGLDSTLALLVACQTFDMLGLSRKGIHAVTMPGFGTSGRTKSNAMKLMEALGVDIREIPIGKAVEMHFRDIQHDPEVRDVTYENAQARMRTLILMDLANEVGGLVLGTGDLSELALGWATYNGDQMSMYGINAGIPKTAIRPQVRWYGSLWPEIAATLDDIIDTPVSPELLPADAGGNIAQKTEDLVGPYELHDFFLYQLLALRRKPSVIYMLALRAFDGQFDSQTIKKWLQTFIRRFFSQQFKRSCMPDGPKVSAVCLSPRGDWRAPSDAEATLWLNNVKNL